MFDMCRPRYVPFLELLQPWPFFKLDQAHIFVVKEWGAHVMTKQHRQSVTREKTQSKSKRPASGDVVGESSKRSKTEDEVVRSSILPAGFFSNGSGPTIVPDEDEEDEAEAAAPVPVPATTASKVSSSGSAPIAPAAAAGSSTTTTATAVPGQTGDVELDDFLASLAEPEPDLESAPSTTNVNASKAKTPSVIKKTTTSYKDVIPGQASYQAAPVRNIPNEDDQSKEEVQPEESESDKRARLAKEEREEMMDRLDEETRAQ
jgi:zinc finger protein 830